VRWQSQKPHSEESLCYFKQRHAPPYFACGNTPIYTMAQGFPLDVPSRRAAHLFHAVLNLKPMSRPIHLFPTLQLAFLLLATVMLGFSVGGCGTVRGWFSPGQKGAAHSVTISWAPTATPVEGYNVYRADAPSGTPTKLTVRLVSETRYTDTTVQAGRSYSYYVTSVDFKGAESSPSANISVTVPNSHN
jgi:hypothetical protein